MSNLDNRQYDAVIVLANLMDGRGNLNGETRARMDRAIGVIKDGRAPMLVPCGWAYRDDSKICIADAMRKYAVEERGIAASAVIPETASRDTVGDAVFTKRNLALPLNWSHVLVVTSTYHLPRALLIFSFVYGTSIQVDGLGADGSDSDELKESEARSVAAFRETFRGIARGDDAAIFERMRARHPFYNGEIHPRFADR
ncbi:MAG TPA: YdcF family protein [Steroidobacteraceae bacterium]|nr:YdcF family protein [Steroidobacteraceae bacterium]